MARISFNRQKSYTAVRGSNPLHRIMSSLTLRWALVLLIVASSAFIITSFINAAPANVEADTGTVSGGSAAVFNDASSSGGKAVKFDVADTPGGAQSCPPLPAYPDANCTGVLPGVSRTNASTMTVSQNGAVIENLTLSGRLTITGDNVTVRNVHLTTSDYYGLMIYGQNITVEDSTFIGGENAQAVIAAVEDGSFIATRVDVSGSPDGVSMGSNSKLIDSYIHDLGDYEGAHNDGINADGRTNTEIIHNTVLNQIGQTSAITVGTTEYGTDVLVRDNLIAGGGYSIYAGLGRGTKGIVMQNNVFSRRYFQNSGAFGPVAYWNNSGGNVWTNNRYEDGTAINP